jgi:hypothetical protein
MATPQRRRSIQARLRQERRATDAQVSRFVDRINRSIDAAAEALAGRIDFEQGQLEQSLAVLDQFNELLEERGFSTNFDEIEDLYSSQIQAVRDAMQQEGLTDPITQVSAETLDRLARPGIEIVQSKLTEQVFDVQQAMIDNILTGQRPDLDAIRENIGARAAANVSTELDTNLAAFNQNLAIQSAIETGGRNPRFLYVGPDDERTRDFCDSILAGESSFWSNGRVPDRQQPIYTLREIGLLDNDQGLSTISFRGGYNCRHVWVPLGNS